MWWNCSIRLIAHLCTGRSLALTRFHYVMTLKAPFHSHLFLISWVMHVWTTGMFLNGLLSTWLSMGITNTLLADSTHEILDTIGRERRGKLKITSIVSETTGSPHCPSCFLPLYPSFYCWESHQTVWDIPVVIGVSCPVCMASQLLVLAGGAMWEIEKTLALCKHCRGIAKTLVCYQRFPPPTLKHSTVGASLMKITSIQYQYGVVGPCCKWLGYSATGDSLAWSRTELMQISNHIQHGSFRICKDPKENLWQDLFIQGVLVKLCSCLALAPADRGWWQSLLSSTLSWQGDSCHSNNCFFQSGTPRGRVEGGHLSPDKLSVLTISLLSQPCLVRRGARTVSCSINPSPPIEDFG